MNAGKQKSQMCTEKLLTMIKIDNHKRYWFIFMLVVLPVIGCNRGEQQPTQKRPATAVPDQQGWNSTLIATKDGQIAAKIQYGYMQRFNDKKIVQKLFGEIAPRFSERRGGYTRITKTVRRRGDNAPLSIIELIPQEEIQPTIRAAKETKGKSAKGKPDKK